MNLRLVLLGLCLAGNVLLAAALFRHGSNSPRPAAPETIISTASPPTEPPPTESAVPATNAVTPDFQWSQLAAPDLAVYIVQLRAFGVPEPTVRDIIFGAVEAIYRPKRGALRPPKKPDDGKFWARRNFYGPDTQMTKAQREQMRALQKEESDLLKSLLGQEVYEQMAKDSGGLDWTERYFASIPKELREKVQDIDSRLNEAKQEIYAAADGYIDQDTQADLRAVEKKYHDELAAVLTPDQLQEWDVRHSETANQLKNNLSAFDPNEAEFRALFKYQQAAQDLNPPRNPDNDTPPPTADERKALQEKQKALDAELAQAIGDDRVKEYKLEQDYGYRNLIEAGVPKDAVFKLDDMKTQAQAASQKVRRDLTLSSDQRNQALSAIRAETQNGINGLLGDKQGKRYLNNGGWWLNNIAPASTSR
jgi:hypothetical protein